MRTASTTWACRRPAAASRSLAPTCRLTTAISKSGYDITYGAIGVQQLSLTTCSTITTATQGYNVFAAPSSPNTTGVRYFGTNENNALFEDADASPRRWRSTVPGPCGD